MHSLTSRSLAALIAAFALASVLGQWWINTRASDAEGAGSELWALLRYFTILTNLLTSAILARVALGLPCRAGVIAGATLSIVMVGAVYHALLAPESPLLGAGWWTDFGLHTIVPCGTALWWLLFAPKELRLAQVPFWLLWPFGYCLYAMVRGAVDGEYPYFFLDLANHSVGFVATYIAGLVATFALVGLVLWGIARILRGNPGAERI